MNFRTMMQTGPVRANELFGKLAETSDAAVRNRDKLFTELKGELEQHLRMEQDHLLPILRKNNATKDLAAEVVKDNRELRSRLVELESLPKSDAAFPKRLAELRKTFREHGRNDRKELLPAVQQALTADAAQEAIAQKEATPKAATPAPAPAAPVLADSQGKPPAGTGHSPAVRQPTDGQAKPPTRVEPSPAARQPADSQGKPPTGIETSLAAAAQAKQQEADQRQAAAAAARRQGEHGSTGLAASPLADQSSQEPARLEPSLAAAVQAKQQEEERRRVEAARQQAKSGPAGGVEAAPAASHGANGAVGGQSNLAAAVLAKQDEAAQQAKRRAEQDRLAAVAASQAEVRQRLELAEREAAAERLRQAAARPATKGAMAAGEGIRQAANAMAEGGTQVGATLFEAGRATLEAMQRMTPGLGSVTSGQGSPVSSMADFGSAWLGFLGQQVAANTQMAHRLAERQRQVATTVWRGLADTNEQTVRITLGVSRQAIMQAAAIPLNGGNAAVRPIAARPNTVGGSTRLPTALVGSR